MTTKILCDKCLNEGGEEEATTVARISFKPVGSDNPTIWGTGIYEIEFDVCQKHFVEVLKLLNKTIQEYR